MFSSFQLAPSTSRPFQKAGFEETELQAIKSNPSKSIVLPLQNSMFEPRTNVSQMHTVNEITDLEKEKTFTRKDLVEFFVTQVPIKISSSEETELQAIKSNPPKSIVLPPQNSMFEASTNVSQMHTVNEFTDLEKEKTFTRKELITFFITQASAEISSIMSVSIEDIPENSLNKLAMIVQKVQEFDIAPFRFKVPNLILKAAVCVNNTVVFSQVFIRRCRRYDII